MTLKISTLLAFAALVALLPTSARADGISYNLAGCPDGYVAPCSGAIASSANYTSGGFTITATGYSAPNVLNGLFIKTAGGDENGLGLNNQLHDEIQPGTFIQLNMTSLAAAGIDTGTMMLGSVQLGEGYKICESSTAGVLGGTCFTGNLDGTPVSFSWSTADPYVSVTATSGDVLIANSISVSTPEPSSLILLGSGLLLLGGLKKKKPA